jgi:SAM-dependent methyltransferase
MIGWDDAATAAAYERFCRRYSRYSRANEVLAREAALAPGLAVLDFGAGTGRTASAILPRLSPGGSVVCVEPAAAMRAAGIQRLRDPRVTWRPDLPEGSAAFDRVLVGAGIWQLDPLDEWLRRLSALLRPGGALAFNIPGLYLGEPDEPGAGEDPLLLGLVGLLASGRPAPGGEAAWRHDAASVETALRAAGLTSRAWTFRNRLSQAAHARWLSIPVLTDGLFPDLDAGERRCRIEEALAQVDAGSFRWERWRGWTAWKL